LQDQNLSKIHQIDNFFFQNNKNTSEFVEFYPNLSTIKIRIENKNTCFMILNDKLNRQVSRILMNPRLIYVKRSENDSFTKDNEENTKACKKAILVFCSRY
jgi:hypothetical protein